MHSGDLRIVENWCVQLHAIYLLSEFRHSIVNIIDSDCDLGKSEQAGRAIVSCKYVKFEFALFLSV